MVSKPCTRSRLGSPRQVRSGWNENSTAFTLPFAGPDAKMVVASAARSSLLRAVPGGSASTASAASWSASRSCAGASDASAAAKSRLKAPRSQRGLMPPEVLSSDRPLSVPSTRRQVPRLVSS